MILTEEEKRMRDGADATHGLIEVLCQPGGDPPDPPTATERS
jgi:hypothetical protein